VDALSVAGRFVISWLIVGLGLLIFFEGGVHLWDRYLAPVYWGRPQPGEPRPRVIVEFAATMGAIFLGIILVVTGVAGVVWALRS
jgi:hypothetical protein